MACFTVAQRHSLQALAITDTLEGSVLRLCSQTSLGRSARTTDGVCSSPQAARTVCVAARATSLNFSEPESNHV
jgi:hypothetical protein